EARKIELTLEARNLELNLEALNALKQVPSWVLVEGFIPHGDKHFQLTKAIRFKLKILSEACSKLRESRDELIDATSDIKEEFFKILSK
ncbi:hypothetical protein KI387_004004, partial [Taxus chinensis]